LNGRAIACRISIKPCGALILSGKFEVDINYKLMPHRAEARLSV
jgi:hypothetical protein